MTALRVLLGLIGLMLAGVIVWAFAAGDFAAASAWLSGEPWGIVTLFDLYLGFLLSAVVIAVMERHWTAALWIAPIPVLGNVWTVVWFVTRFPVLVARWRHQP